MTGFLIPLGYKLTSFDPCVMVHVGNQIIIAIYVDDISIFGTNPLRNELKESLKKEFDLSDLGPLNPMYSYYYYKPIAGARWVTNVFVLRSRENKYIYEENITWAQEKVRNETMGRYS